MKTLDFSYDCFVTNVNEYSIGDVFSLLKVLEYELDFQESSSLYYVETFDEIKDEAVDMEICEYDYAMNLIQGYAIERARIVLFASLGLIALKDRDSYLEIIDVSIALCKKFLRESAIWKG